MKFDRDLSANQMTKIMANKTTIHPSLERVAPRQMS